MNDTLELGSEQILAPVDTAALEALLSPRTLTALRRRHPQGSGVYLVCDDGRVFFDPGPGEAPFPLTQIEAESARRVPRLKRDVDVLA